MRPICFLSDFGLGDDFVGLCKGVMLGIAPQATVIDLTHQVSGFAVEEGAEILEHATRYMPEKTIYLAIVDPGVGTERRALALSTTGGALLVGPDNGLLIPAAEALGGIESAVSLTNADYHLRPVSNTFHGRDVFSPATAYLATGLSPSKLGEVVDPTSLARVKLPGIERAGPNAFSVTIIGVDRYGNARLSATAEEVGLRFGALLRVEAAENGEMPVRYVETFGHSKVGDLVLVPDSHRRLSLSVNKGHAFRALGMKAGARVRLTLLENGPKPDERDTKSDE
ncbi:MAG: SAM-dependent chlorinase/fluorinase [Actinomycetota bacterium]|nr:SAM-dependent chlorinase/fluorinase [Actinomycetota bacterium]